jgi:hypothetical protein
MITTHAQRWRSGSASYQPAGSVIRPSDYDVVEIAEDVAKAFVIEHHYSGTYPAARRRFGLYEHGTLVGVAVFSHPCNEKTITNVFGCSRAADGLELGRFVLLDRVPANGESWFLARCRQALRHDYVGVVSFSDDTRRATSTGEICFAGHIGTIYQASNAAFLGRGTARTLRLLPDGKVLSDRTIQKIRSGERGQQYAIEILQSYGAGPVYGWQSDWLATWLPRLTRTVKHPGNLRYAWSFSKAVKLESLAYPKFTLGGTRNHA